MKMKTSFRRTILLLFVIFISNVLLYSQKFEGLALTPPMGWNSWNKFACDINENLIRETADALVSSGLKDAGYKYIVIDDCWHGQRDSLGFIHPDPVRFPSGIKALTDYVHSKGLKFGIYSCAGDKTCGGKPASRGYEYQDALTYAKWGVDYLKYDWCNTEGLDAKSAYTTMSMALKATGRPIVFSLCEWGNNKPWEWATNVGHLWRTTGDIYNCFDCEKNHGTWSSWGVLKILDMQVDLRKYAGPGHWNDPDMLEVGNGMPVNEDRAHFSMWCMIAAPLIAGNDVRSMSKETHDILTNKEVLSVDQDSLGIQGFKYSTKDSLETWFKPLKDGDWAVCFLNRSLKPVTVEFNWTKQNVVDDLSKRRLETDKTTYQIKNLWTKDNEGKTDKIFKKTVLAHDVIMLRLIKGQK
jgi:Alpha-galactosidase